ncbi:hypothetical protein BH09VER1_BH09VER1_30810 [soil metagenome]
MHARSMKTITLTDESYDRLKAWKDGPESFSSVVLRLVPKRGTAADMRSAFAALDTLGPEHGQLLQRALRKEPAR